jgi:hypothetical protein
MINRAAEKILSDCLAELNNIQSLLVGMGDDARPTPYLKKYAVIRATGSIETSFKQIIADKVDRDSHSQVKNFIRTKVRESSCNPKLSIIENMLSDFDDRWRARFEEQMALDDKPKLKKALSDLVTARNAFAHGGNPNMAIDTTIFNFNNGIRVIEILDAVVHFDFELE